MEQTLDRFGTPLKVGDRVIYPVTGYRGALQKFEQGTITSIKEGKYVNKLFISPTMDVKHSTSVIKYNYPESLPQLDPVVQEWLNNLYTEAIEEAKQSIKNERIWEKGYNEGAYESNPHTENIKTIEQYISVLTRLQASTRAQTAPKQTRKEELYDAMLGYLVELINKNDLVATLLNLGFTKSELEKEGILEEGE